MFIISLPCTDKAKEIILLSKLHFLTMVDMKFHSDYVEIFLSEQIIYFVISYLIKY